WKLRFLWCRRPACRLRKQAGRLHHKGPSGFRPAPLPLFVVQASRLPSPEAGGTPAPQGSQWFPPSSSTTGRDRRISARGVIVGPQAERVVGCFGRQPVVVLAQRAQGVIEAAIGHPEIELSGRSFGWYGPVLLL